MIVLEWAGAVLMVLGGVVSLTAAVGMVRLPDVAARLQAATKPQTMGLALVALGAAPFVSSGAAIGMRVLVVLLQLAVSPVLAQMVVRSAYRTGGLRRDLLVLDELAEQADEPGS